MFFADLLFVLIIAVLLTLIFGVGFRRHSFGNGLFFFFLIVFLATWAGGSWVTPVGPALWGSYWLTFLVVGFFVALVVAALTVPDRYPRSRQEAEEEAAAAVSAVFVIDILFWVLIIALAVSIIASYVQ